MSYARLLDEWSDLLERRPTFREPLAPYRKILEAWAQWSGDRVAPLRWSAEDCRERWRRGTPLLAEAAPSIPPEEMEGLLAPALEFLVTIGRDDTALARFAEAWDHGDVSPAALFPDEGRVGSAAAQERSGLSQESVAFLAHASLRPILESYFADCRPHLTDSAWHLGGCPFCSGRPGFAELLEGGQRRLTCHLCGAGWIFPRLECAYCGSRSAKDLAVLRAEETEEGYSISICKACRAYVKEVDRRLRWNAGPALIEDWGSPHLDLIAHRAGHWRAMPTLIQLKDSA